ncbi:MAG: DUF697 domain-containing protein [Planctomycetes bacterium]|nr:DUF697 domain-containing protein [Planctomycetota bacterium]
MTGESAPADAQYQQAMNSLAQTLANLQRCSVEEKSRLRDELDGMRDMLGKLTSGRVEIVVFGEISTGKSALINALIGKTVASVDVRGGWTRELWHVAWDGCGYCVPGLGNSEVVLIDTPGLNEVGGQARGEMAREAAQRSDLILFVTDSDLTESEHTAICELAQVQKPILVVLNKIDLYSPDQRGKLLQVLRDERLQGVIAAVDVVTTAADPRKIEYVIQSADGTTRHEWRKPEPDVAALKGRILEVLDRDGLALVSLNAAIFAADTSDRIAALRVQLRDRRASQIVISYASLKAVTVALSPAVVDIFAGSALDILMVGTLAHAYGLNLSWTHAQALVTSILKATGWVLIGEAATRWLLSSFKALTANLGMAVTAIPQGAAAGYGSYIVGQAAKYYFEHGSSWGPEGPKAVVHQILEQTDKQSVLEKLKGEIRSRMRLNPHAGS